MLTISMKSKQSYVEEDTWAQRVSPCLQETTAEHSLFLFFLYLSHRRRCDHYGVSGDLKITQKEGAIIHSYIIHHLHHSYHDLYSLKHCKWCRLIVAGHDAQIMVCYTETSKTGGKKQELFSWISVDVTELQYFLGLVQVLLQLLQQKIEITWMSQHRLQLKLL